MSGDCALRLATLADEAEVDEFLRAVDMGISGDICEHVLLHEDGELLGVAKFTPVRAQEYHLDTLAIRADRKGSGLGSLLLKRLLAAPWECFDGYEAVPAYTVTTISRGTAVPFYRKFGFVPCDFADIHWQFVDQCDSCPVRAECDPQPMLCRKG